jgi:hypothetical protein
VAFLLSLTLLAASPTTAQTPGGKSDLGANAALKYWRAFALLPTLDKEEQKLLNEWDKAPVDAAARKLIDRSRLSRLDLHRGAMLTRCDWSLDEQDGINMRIPHLTKARALARLVALHARQEFEQGHPKAGWQDVSDLLKLSRHVGIGPTLIERLVGYAIERMAIETAAPYLPGSKSVLPEAASEVLDKLPALPTLEQMVQSEKRLGAGWLIQELKKAEGRKKGSWQEVWNEFSHIATNLEPKNPDAEALKSVKTFEQAIKMLEDLLPVYDQVAKKMALPWKEFDAQYPKFFKKARADNPLAQVLLPAMDRVADSERRHLAQMALFKAALAVVQGGPDRVKDFKDPAGDGAVEYRALDKGFELRSKLLFQGKPLTLTVGTGKTK